MTTHLSSPLNSTCASLLLPLFIRAQETQRPNPILKDEWAVEMVGKLHFDNAQFAQAKVSEEVQVSILLRNRQFDRIARDFLHRNPGSIVVYLGCGLDARFERLDNQQVEWFDLDLPEVIQLRRELMGTESCRYHLLACSVLDLTWMDQVIMPPSPPTLILAEGLLMFFTEPQVKQLVLAIKQRFPGAELVFDAFSPFYAWGNNRRVSKTGVGALVGWSLKDPHLLEGWSAGIRLVSTWYPFLQDEPRLSHLRWVRHFPILAKTTGIFHYNLS
jgi:O-methyltransferase involved in polyketide biosynthesis